MYYNPNYRKFLEQYGFGDWLQKNSTSIGTVTGAGLGFAIGGPAGAALGASLGGQVGGSVQQNYQQNEAVDSQLEQMKLQQQQQAYQNRVNTASQGLTNNKLQDNQFSGMNRFANGGTLSGPNPESLFAMHLADPSTNRRGIYRDLTPQSQRFILQNPGFNNSAKAGFQTDMRGGTTNFYGADGNDKINYITATQPFTGTDMNEYQTHLDAMQAKQSQMDNFRLEAPSIKPNLTASYRPLPIQEQMAGGDEVEFAMGGNLYPKNNATGINSYPLRNLKYAMGGDLTKYTGQDHGGKNGGIAVDSNGSPSQTTGNEPVGLVEDGEVSHRFEDGNVYIFSNKIAYKK